MLKNPFCSEMCTLLQGSVSQTLVCIRITRVCLLKHSMLGSTKSIVLDSVGMMWEFERIKNVHF